MKLMSISLLGVVTFGAHLKAEQPTKVVLPISKVYSVEKGFDDNDSVEVSVFGFLPDTCHKIERSYAKVDPANKKITVEVDGIVRQQEVCLEILTPFLEVVQLGTLDAGNYEIKAVNNTDLKANLEVKLRSTDSRDDFVYAPVDTVELERDPYTLVASDRLTLKGTYPYMLKGCMRVVKVKVSSFNKEVLVVQPITEILEDRDCHASDVGAYNRFTITTQVGKMLNDRGLVHVRTLNGRALNKLVDFTQK